MPIRFLGATKKKNILTPRVRQFARSMHGLALTSGGRAAQSAGRRSKVRSAALDFGLWTLNSQIRYTSSQLLGLTDEPRTCMSKCVRLFAASNNSSGHSNLLLRGLKLVALSGSGESQRLLIFSLLVLSACQSLLMFCFLLDSNPIEAHLETRSELGA